MDMPYADFEYYTGTYHGTSIPEEKFPYHARQASMLINALTFGRTEAVDASLLPDAVKDATCRAAELYAEYEARKSNAAAATQNGLVKSENNDGFSVSYADYDASADKASTEKTIEGELAVYLAHTGLMYRGFSAYWDKEARS